MNKERLLELATRIRNTPYDIPSQYEVDIGEEGMQELEGFNMRFLHCGSVACLCGWSRYIWDAPEYLSGPETRFRAKPSSFSIGAQILGLEQSVADYLFWPTGLGGYGPAHNAEILYNVTPKQAAEVLELMVEREPKTNVEMVNIWEEVLGLA